jgi:hypothetical protein
METTYFEWKDISLAYNPSLPGLEQDPRQTSDQFGFDSQQGRMLQALVETFE